MPSLFDLQTGAWTPIYLLERLPEFTQSARRSRSPLTLLYVDVDRVQELNDMLTNEAVDPMLESIAEGLARILDGRGPIARMAPGAFLAVLPNVGGQEARTLAEDVRLGMAQPGSAERPPFSVSIGLASLRRMQAPWDLLDAAEQACTKAKQAGGDCVAGP